MPIIQNPVLARDADNTIDLNANYNELNLKAKNLADDVVAFTEAAAADLETAAATLDAARDAAQAAQVGAETAQGLAAGSAVAAQTAEQNAAAYLDQMQTTYQTIVNSIGTPGAAGFGVGICPGPLFTGMTPLYGYTDPTHPQYGNYQYTDGSTMVWVPKFYYRIGHADNPTFGVHGVNSIDIKGVKFFPSRTQAESQGYALHRAFIDGGAIKDGFFVDKYLVSSVAKGSGFVAASIQNGNPISTAADHNPIAGITASPANAYYSAVNAAKGRSGTNGALDAASPFFCCSLPIYSALALLATAHGQAATSTTYCAWWSASTTNFPKGCNNNALKDVNDTAVTWQSDGYSNCGKTGSAGFGGGAGNVFAKSTHNGQDCGIADLNGLLFEVALGMTCIATTKTITGASQANPCVITSAAHGFTTGKLAMITGVAGMTQLNDKLYTVTVVDANTFSINVDATGFSAYVSGGLATSGTFYAAKEATAMKTFTAGTTLATDHWGATGVAAMMEEILPPMEGAFAQRWGNAANQVLGGAISGNGYRATGFGLPRDIAAISAAGSNLFGADYWYQYVRDMLCPFVGGTWSSSAYAGVWCRYWGSSRSSASDNVGFRCACYL